MFYTILCKTGRFEGGADPKNKPPMCSRICEILDVAKAGQLVDQTEQSPKSAFLTARKEQIYARAADRQIGSRVCGSA